jgi:hypothetical protein
LDGRVFEVQAFDGGGSGQTVDVKELGLNFAAVGSFAVPPESTLAVQDMAGGA